MVELAEQVRTGVVDTLPKLLLCAAREYGNRKVAMRKKEFGIWIEYTWSRVYDEVRNLAAGLHCLNLSRGDKVCIIGDNCPEWFCAEYAVQSLGAIAVGLYTDASRNELAYIVGDCDARFVFASDQEQIDKFLDIKDSLPKLEWVIYWDPKGLWDYKDPLLLSWTNLVEKGKAFLSRQPSFFEEAVGQTNGEDIALILYTSGTSALPKGAMRNHRGLIQGCLDWARVEGFEPTGQYVSYISPAWIAEQSYGLCGLVATHYEISFPEKPETTHADIREIAPTILFFGSRQWESIASQIQAKIADSTFLKRAVYNIGMKLAYKVADYRLQRRSVNLLWRMLYYLDYLVLLRPLKDKIGCLKVKHAYTGGSMLSPDVIRFFHAIGVPITNNYGLTEAAPGTLQRIIDIDINTVGSPLGNEVRIAGDGEILFRGYGIFQGYYKRLEDTAKVVDKDGWFHTGDAGYFTEMGHLTYVDRVKELVELKDGTRFSPAYIEAKMRFSPYIADVVVIGGKEWDYISALVQIDLENVGRWAEKNRIVYTTFRDLSQKEKVLELVHGEIERVNRGIPEPWRIRRFCNLHKQLDPDESELTRTRKLRRGYIAEKYAALIKAIYDDHNSCFVETDVVYEDGTKGKVATEVKIVSLNDRQ